MHKDNLVVIFVFVLFIMIAYSMLAPVFSPTGDVTGLTGKICTASSDCADGKVCCPFYGQTSGVCDYADSCEKISEITQTQKLPEAQTPHEYDPRPFYLGIMILFVAVLVIVFIFFKKARKPKNYEE